MATFGEIVEPTSRSAWEDWDDTSQHNNIQLQWRSSFIDNVESEDTIIILEGKYLSDCVRMKSQHLELINSIPQANLNLYRRKSTNNYVCTVRDYNLVLSTEIVEILRPFIFKCKDVIAIQTKALAEYQSMQSFTQECVMKMLTTSTPANSWLDVKFTKLEQPNIIYGVTAGVLTLREHINLPARAIVCYMEHPEEYKIKDLQMLLEKLNISQNSASRPTTVLDSNLYI